MSEKFSESTYAFAFTHELLRWVGTSLQAAPVFPSTWEEGQSGVGYDVMLDRPGIPLFIQFKLSEYLVQRNAKEAREALKKKVDLHVPYYRIHLMPASRSKQHEMLIALQISGNEVRYAAPKFHARKDLDANFRNHSLLSRSLYVKPLEIGPLPDAQPHSYAFDAAGNHFFCSDPTLLKANNEYEVFVSELEAKLDGGGIQDSREVGKALQGHLAELALSQIRDPQRDERIGEVWVEAEAKSKAHPLEFCASIVHHLAQASLFWVTRKPPETSTLP